MLVISYCVSYRLNVVLDESPLDNFTAFSPVVQLLTQPKPPVYLHYKHKHYHLCTSCHHHSLYYIYKYINSQSIPSSSSHIAAGVTKTTGPWKEYDTAVLFTDVTTALSNDSWHMSHQADREYCTGIDKAGDKWISCAKLVAWMQLIPNMVLKLWHAFPFQVFSPCTLCILIVVVIYYNYYTRSFAFLGQKELIVVWWYPKIPNTCFRIRKDIWYCICISNKKQVKPY